MKNKFIANIDLMYWANNASHLCLEGYLCVKDKKLNMSKDIKQSLIVSCDNYRYVVPLNNIDCNKYDGGEDCFYFGFSGFIDVSFIDNMDSIGEGIWSISLNVRIADVNLILPLNSNNSVCDIETKQFLNKKQNCFVEISPIVKEDVLFLNSVKSKNANYIAVKKSREIFKKGFKYFLKSISNAIAYDIYDFYKSRPLKENTILFLSDSRSNLSGNFEFVYNELKSRGDYDIQMFLKPAIDSEFSLKDKLKFLKAIATSKYILLDDYYPKIYNFELREDVELVQLWHACGAFKTFGFSRLGKEGGPKSKSKSHRNYTKAFVSSDEIRKFYAEGFGISEDRVYATGIPRTDIFFDDDYKNKKIKELTEKYQIIKNKKVIVFAPTFRGNGQKTAYYDFNRLDIESLYKEFGKEYVILFKLHPFVKNKPVFGDKYKDFIIDVTDEREINDLLFISDILITDYSSVCFEYALLNKPMIFFAYDMDDYISKRDFYYPYKDFVPGPIAKTTEDIINIIKTKDYKLDKLNSFRKRFFDDFDGQSTKRVVDVILNKNNKR